MATLTARAFDTTYRTSIAIGIAGLIGAAIDALYFSASALMKGHSPVKVLQSIASFWLGPKSMDLGATSALLGVATHIGLSTIMATGFLLLVPRVEILRRSTLVGGLLYGLVLYVVMYLVVLPLRWPALYPRWDGWRSLLDIAVHLAIDLSFAFLFRSRGFLPQTRTR